ncbi:hypothetical protein XELAEV_18000057mg [Xenopus laevis]|uniref:Uncharacterized protein n=1 Tax=Xenopus laevis TaxID=8355 RepID=A0A974GYX1_XENLA|nr:hypothetical protein XELAEV_18000057mg [Xenopus laevis]
MKLQIEALTSVLDFNFCRQHMLSFSVLVFAGAAHFPSYSGVMCIYLGLNGWGMTQLKRLNLPIISPVTLPFISMLLSVYFSFFCCRA